MGIPVPLGYILLNVYSDAWYHQLFGLKWRNSISDGTGKDTISKYQNQRPTRQALALIAGQNHTNGSLRRVASACSSSSSRTTVPDWPPANRNATR